MATVTAISAEGRVIRMSEYAELPWSVEDTIENLKELKEGLQERCIIQNLHGRGEKDAEEVAFDFDRAIKSLEEVQQYRAIGTVSELQDLVIGINALADSQFTAADMAKLVNDMKSLYEYRQIGTVEECRAAVEKQAEKKVFVVVQGNYALSKNMDAFSTRELADGFRKHIRKESNFDGCINVFELEVDGAVLKEEYM